MNVGNARRTPHKRPLLDTTRAPPPGHHTSAPSRTQHERPLLDTTRAPPPLPDTSTMTRKTYSLTQSFTSLKSREHFVIKHHPKIDLCTKYSEKKTKKHETCLYKTWHWQT